MLSNKNDVFLLFASVMIFSIYSDFLLISLSFIYKLDAPDILINSFSMIYY